MDIQTSLRRAIHRLRLADIPSAALDAELLLAHVLKRPREMLLANPETRVSARAAEVFGRLVDQRSRHRPLAYLVHQRSFYGLDFFVDERVLIPRPATETLFETVLARVRQRPRPGSLADIGTGSGCLAILFAKYLPTWAILASDASAEALTVARRNAKTHDVKDRITFLHGSLFKPYKGKKLAVAVANLPYLPAGVLSRSGLPGMTKDARRTLRFEPADALTDKSLHGLTTMTSFLRQAPTQLEPGGLIALEVYPPRISQIVELATEIFPLATAETVNDLSGLPHFVLITL